MARYAAVLIMVALMLFSCQSGRKAVHDHGGIVGKNSTISFLAGGKYLAELDTDAANPTLSIPELGISDLRLKEYGHDPDVRLFGDTMHRINIMLYDDHLVLMLGNDYEDVCWMEKGRLFDFYEKT